MELFEFTRAKLAAERSERKAASRKMASRLVIGVCLSAVLSGAAWLLIGPRASGLVAVASIGVLGHRLLFSN
jgi:hypothetical protein